VPGFSEHAWRGRAAAGVEAFYAIHDPTAPNRRGADVGTQYRSIVLYQSDERPAAAGRAIGDMDREGPGAPRS